jgi:hypothetical protein
VGFVALVTIPRLLRGKPRATRFRVALALAGFTVMCFAVLVLLPNP